MYVLYSDIRLQNGSKVMGMNLIFSFSLRFRSLSLQMQLRESLFVILCETKSLSLVHPRPPDSRGLLSIESKIHSPDNCPNNFIIYNASKLSVWCRRNFTNGFILYNAGLVHGDTS